MQKDMLPFDNLSNLNNTRTLYHHKHSENEIVK